MSGVTVSAVVLQYVACWYWREMTAYRIVGNFCREYFQE